MGGAHLETSSQRGPLRVASRKVASMSDLILRSAKVSCLGHLFPLLVPASGTGCLMNSSKSAGGRLLMGDAASTSWGCSDSSPVVAAAAALMLLCSSIAIINTPGAVVAVVVVVVLAERISDPTIP